ncbi:MAG: type III-A CRISPR-associated protein Csm2 [Petrotogales bacterium]
MGRKRGSRRRKNIEFPEKIGEMDGEEIRKIAEKMGESHQGNKNQVRKMYNAFKKIQVEWSGYEDKEGRIEETIGQIQLVRPKLAYSAGRNQEMNGLKKDIDKLIENLEPKVDDINNFFKLMESFIGYHKYYSEV